MVIKSKFTPGQKNMENRINKIKGKAGTDFSLFFINTWRFLPDLTVTGKFLTGSFHRNVAFILFYAKVSGKMQIMSGETIKCTNH
ncbi:MAG TPA: hypothetical protein DE060_08990 [Lentisphaeria bacterium]|nr:hypothetical protein [Lentisphaeria bacterium]HCG49321.1 hypothetical protein [Lentisphaeria bacterium]